MTSGGDGKSRPAVDAGADIAETFAKAWNSVNDDRALAVDFWPCCRVLADAQLLVAQETSLAAVSIGPFRLAMPKENQPVVDFVEVLFPSTIASAATGQVVQGAVAGVLTAACTVFVKLYRQGTVFGRSPDDRLRWEVLMTVRNDNSRAVHPSRKAVVAALTDHPDSRVQDAIDWLLGSGEHDRGSRSPLLTRHDDGGLLAMV